MHSLVVKTSKELRFNNVLAEILWSVGCVGIFFHSSPLLAAKLIKHLNNHFYDLLFNSSSILSLMHFTSGIESIKSLISDYREE